jgi:DNA-binding transcriptional ArsR family regulator
MDEVAGTLRVMADASRLRLLTLLAEGDATVSDLAARLDLSQPRVSSQLAMLRAAGLVSVRTSGRQRAYHVDPERFTAAMTAVAALIPQHGQPADADTSPPISRQAAGLVQRDAAIRRARTCYDHLAGVAGVQLLDELLRRDWLAIESDDGKRMHYRLTGDGARELTDRGVTLTTAAGSRRLYAYGCLDWTERRPHLGGALGAAILQSLTDRGIVERGVESRTARLHSPIEHWLDAGG